MFFFFVYHCSSVRCLELRTSARVRSRRPMASGETPRKASIRRHWGHLLPLWWWHYSVHVELPVTIWRKIIHNQFLIFQCVKTGSGCRTGSYWGKRSSTLTWQCTIPAKSRHSLSICSCTPISRLLMFAAVRSQAFRAAPLWTRPWKAVLCTRRAGRPSPSANTQTESTRTLPRSTSSPMWCPIVKWGSTSTTCQTPVPFILLSNFL